MSNQRDVVVIGTSFGGISAIGKLAASWPQSLRVAILVAFDTSAQPPSTVLEILQSYAPFQMRYAYDFEEIRPGRIYLGPPDQHIVVAEPGIVRLVAGSVLDPSCPSADRLFSSAARVFGPRVIGVLLTGSTRDGTRGMEAIERAGGIGIVQDPSDALDPTMPLAAIRGDHPDYCVRVDEMAALIEQLASGLVPLRR